jgi:AsmA-like C-terminal region
MDLNQFLSASGSKSQIYGTANGSIDVRGRGGDGNQLAQSLVGSGAIAISNGKFTSFDMMKQVEVLGKLVNLPTGGAATAFRSLKTNLRFDRGKMSTDALQLLMEDLQVNGNGVMQLGNAPTISYDLLAKLSPALTKRVLPGGDSSGGKSPLGFLGGASSVVGNFFLDQGGIVIPLKVSGPMNQPVFGLNSALVQQRAKEQLKSNLTEGLLDRFTKKSDETKPGEKKQDDKKPAEKKPADALKGVLDQFRKKEKP